MENYGFLSDRNLSSVKHAACCVHKPKKDISMHVNILCNPDVPSRISALYRLNDLIFSER